jgi:hypothetical protein
MTRILNSEIGTGKGNIALHEIETKPAVTTLSVGAASRITPNSPKQSHPLVVNDGDYVPHVFEPAGRGLQVPHAPMHM